MNPWLNRAVILSSIVTVAAWSLPAHAETGVEILAPRPAPALLVLAGNIQGASSMQGEELWANALLHRKPSDAFLRSAILPGWGQRYSGRKTRGAVFTAVDAGIWLSLAWSYQAWHFGENQFIAFGQEHAFLSGSHDHGFYVDIGNFSDRDAYNEARRQQRDYSGQYRGADTWWEWDSAENRLTFKNLRIQADRNKNRISYLIGALVLNRVVSAIDASRGLAKRQKDAVSSGSLSLEYSAEVNGPSLVWRGNLAGK
ncbi:MAG: hypothetical protein V2A56_12200 [bacterium]